MSILRAGFACLVVCLSACGGSGGGGGGTSFDPVSVTTGVALATTGVIIESVDGMDELAVGNPLSGVAIDNASLDIGLVDIALQQLGRAGLVDMLAAGSALTGVSFSETIDCTDGSFRVSGDVSGEELSAGDTINFRFYDCAEDGIVLNGRFNITIVDILPGFDGLAPYDMTLDVELGSFTVGDGLLSAWVDGDMLMDLSDDDAGNVNFRMTGNRLETRAGDEIVLLTGYDYRIEGLANADFSIDIAGTIGTNDPAVDGEVNFETLTSFTGNDLVANGNPTAGQLLITTELVTAEGGPDNSSALVTAQGDGINVRIQVDEDGDTLYEIDCTTSWDNIGDPLLATCM